MDPQHENQLFFASVITQAKTVNSIPKNKLNNPPQNQTLKNTRHNFARFCNSLTGNEGLEQRLIIRVAISCLFLRFVLIFKGNVLKNVNVLISKKRAYF